VLVDQHTVEATRPAIDSTSGKSYLLKVGKRRFARVAFQ
jgi:hypothetical protein